MVVAAGGGPVPATAGERSRRLSWEEFRKAAIDVTVCSPSGFDPAGAVDQTAAFLGRPEAAALGRIVAFDANAHFSRPGPRVVDGVELLADLLHSEIPGTVPDGVTVLGDHGDRSLLRRRT